MEYIPVYQPYTFLMPFQPFQMLQSMQIPMFNACIMLAPPQQTFEGFLTFPSPSKLENRDSASEIEEKRQLVQHQQVYTCERGKNKFKSQAKTKESALKNAELNIINQYFSYFKNLSKSRKSVVALLKLFKKSISQSLLRWVQATFKLLNSKRIRKYTNLKNLRKLFSPTELLKSVPQMQNLISEDQFFSLAQLCMFLKKSVIFYCQNISTISILTSKRIGAIARQAHLSKVRKILQTLKN